MISSAFTEAVVADLRTEGVHVTTVERLLGDAAPAFRAALARYAPLTRRPPDARCWTARHASTDLSPGELLERFPEGYRHLAYLQTQIGYNVKLNMPGLKGPEVEKLYAEGRAWLEGSATAGQP